MDGWEVGKEVNVVLMPDASIRTSTGDWPGT